MYELRGVLEGFFLFERVGNTPYSNLTNWIKTVFSSFLACHTVSILSGDIKSLYQSSKKKIKDFSRMPIDGHINAFISFKNLLILCRLFFFFTCIGLYVYQV